MDGAGHQGIADGAKISVVIPTYNSTPHIATVLGSIFGQTLLPAEIVVADDASKDGTPELVESIAATAPIPIRLLRSERNSGGPARSLNRAIDAATGTLIATIDHDDTMRPTKLSRLKACWEADPTLGFYFSRCTRPIHGDSTEGMVVANANRVIDSLRRREIGPGLYRIESEEAFERLLQICFVVSCSSLLFPKTVWSKVGGFDETFASFCDYQFALRSAMDLPIGLVDEILFEWVEHQANFTSNMKIERSEDEGIRFLTALYAQTSRPNSKRLVRAKLCRELFDSAYGSRDRGQYRQSLRRYWQLIRHGDLSLKVLSGFAKLLPHRMIRGHHASLSRR